MKSPAPLPSGEHGGEARRARGKAPLVGGAGGLLPAGGEGGKTPRYYIDKSKFFSKNLKPLDITGFKSILLVLIFPFFCTDFSVLLYCFFLYKKVDFVQKN